VITILIPSVTLYEKSLKYISSIQSTDDANYTWPFSFHFQGSIKTSFNKNHVALQGFRNQLRNLYQEGLQITHNNSSRIMTAEQIYFCCTVGLLSAYKTQSYSFQAITINEYHLTTGWELLGGPTGLIYR
jgi:hypothetical protein